MRNLKTSLLVGAVIFNSLTLTAFSASFSDVPENHSNYAAIESLKNLKIINGYSDGTFKPAGVVNRAEALKMILTSGGIEALDSDASEELFPDVKKGDWFGKFVYKAKKSGIVSGNQDGTFAPGRQVSKAEFLKMLITAFNIDISQHKNLSAGVSKDTSSSDWFLPYVSYAKTVGIIYPTTGDKLEPNKLLTRAECAEIIYKLLLIQKGGDAQKLLSIAEANLVTTLLKIQENDVQAAINSANSAVFYTEQALKVKPNESIVKAANKIAQGFRELCLGYQAGLEGRTDDLKNHIAKARDFAGQAYNEDQTTQSLGKKIKTQADILEKQLQ